MKWCSLVGFFLLFSYSSLAVVFVSSSGLETYEPGLIWEPEDNKQVKAILQKAYDAMKSGDRSGFPLALGAGTYFLEDHWQGVSFGSHAYGTSGQSYLSTGHLQKKALADSDIIVDRKTLTALVRVKGGNTQGQVLDMANAALAPELQKEFEFFMTGPSSEHISVGGALAAHTHYRSTYPYAGFFLDQVENFTLATIQDGKAVEIFCSREYNTDLFHSIPGSFGRGGVITDVTLKLQLVPRDFRPTTTIVKSFNTLEEFHAAFAEGVRSLREPGQVNAFNKAFLGINGFMSDNLFYILTFNFLPLKMVRRAPSFEIFNEPDVLTFIGHYGSQHWHRLANVVTEYYALRGENLLCKNELRPWLFFHNGYLDAAQTFNSMKRGVSSLVGEVISNAVIGKSMDTAHQGYVMRYGDFERFMSEFTRLLKTPQFAGMQFKFRDFVPVPSTRTLMSPAYSEDPNELFLVATLSWPVNSEEENKQIDALKHAIAKLDYVKIHPHKEFDPESDLLYKSYSQQAQELERILVNHRIDDRVIWTKMRKALFAGERP